MTSIIDEFHQRDLVDAAGVTEITIRNRYKGIKETPNIKLT